MSLQGLFNIKSRTNPPTTYVSHPSLREALETTSKIGLFVNSLLKFIRWILEKGQFGFKGKE
jgi:hypothetical protein